MKAVSSAVKTLGEHPHQSTMDLYSQLQPRVRLQLTNRKFESM
jgi:hypothetical protein